MEIRQLTDPQDILGFDPRERDAIGRTTGRLLIKCACGRKTFCGSLTPAAKFQKLTGWRYIHAAGGWQCPHCLKYNNIDKQNEVMA